MKEPKKILKIVLLFLFLIFIFLILIIIFQINKKKDLSKQQDNFSKKTIISPTSLITPSIFFHAKEAVVFLKKINDFTYQILASSNDLDIVGFDFIIESENVIDLEYLKASSLLPSFSLSQSKKENFLILTGFKKLNTKEITIFNETPIVEIKLTKSTKLNLKNSWKKYTSKMVDNQNNILKPRIVLK